MNYYCKDCPRSCDISRAPNTVSGFCASPSLPVIARAAPHFGEEPCISGTRGSGTIFFTGCNLRCVFCQNREISRGSAGREVTVSELRDIMLRLRDEGVHNINLVTGTHFTRAISQALDGLELGIPVVWNSSGYECVETLRMLEGLVQIYMPDMKYALSAPAKRYSAAGDYPEQAKAAILEMYRQVGDYILGSDGMLRSGVLIRHLILPEQEVNTMEVIDWVSDTFTPGSVLFSLMSQYTPMPGLERWPELMNTIDARTAQHMYNYMRKCGIEDGFWQDIAAATDEMIPDFDLTGVNDQSRKI